MISNTKPCYKYNVCLFVILVKIDCTGFKETDDFKGFPSVSLHQIIRFPNTH